MLSKNSPEYKTVIELYNDGRITAADRDRLLAALDNDDGDSNTAGKRSTTSELALDGVFDDTNETDDTDEKAKRTVGARVKELGIKISDSVKASVRAASDAIDKFGDNLRVSLKNAMRSFADKLDEADEIGKTAKPVDDPFSPTAPNRTNDDEKLIPELYSVPYKKLVIEISYIGITKKPVVLSAKTRYAEKLKAKCKKIMSARACEAVAAVLDERFVGKYEYSAGDEMLKITIRPKKR